jgi:hypothetical protein
MVLIYVRGRVDPAAIVFLEGLGQLNLIGNRTCDLPGCSIIIVLDLRITHSEYV